MSLNDIEFENCQQITVDVLRKMVSHIKTVGVNLKDVEAIWFQEGEFAVLEMLDGTRKTMDWYNIDS